MSSEFSSIRYKITWILEKIKSRKITPNLTCPKKKNKRKEKKKRKGTSKPKLAQHENPSKYPNAKKSTISQYKRNIKIKIDHQTIKKKREKKLTLITTVEASIACNKSPDSKSPYRQTHKYNCFYS